MYLIINTMINYFTMVFKPTFRILEKKIYSHPTRCSYYVQKFHWYGWQYEHQLLICGAICFAYLNIPKTLKECQEYIEQERKRYYEKHRKNLQPKSSIIVYENYYL